MQKISVSEELNEIEISPKQKEILKVLEDDVHTEIFMGGAAGGSKSFTGCLWQIIRRINYDGSRGFIARARLKSLKESTLLTFFEVARMIGLKLNGKGPYDFTYNAISGLIKFNNGSEEYLRDLFYYPSDPEFVGLGSTEYTDGFIDEMAEIGEQAYQIIRSRMRFKLDFFDKVDIFDEEGKQTGKTLIPKIAMGSNPCKTFIYKEFYRKWNEKKLEHFKAYIPASVYDNPFISEHYIENLKKLDPINKARLLEGNWEYDDDPTKLFEYDAIVDLFTNSGERGEKYATVDVAGRGRDRTVVMIWDGFHVTKIYLMDNISNEELDEILTKHKIPRSRCAVDEDGVGYGLVKDTKGVKGFINNARPITKKSKVETDTEQVTHNYANLKAQCWFELSSYVNSGRIGIYRELDVETKKLLIEDLEQIKQKDPGKDAPLRILTKDEIKETLGRSTDIGDALMMRMYFVLKPPLAFGFIDARPKPPKKTKEEIEKEKKQKEEQIKELVEKGVVSFAPKARGRKEKESLTNKNI